MTAVKTIDYKNDGEFHEKLIEEVLTAYPEKTAKKRSKHLAVTQEGASDCGVKSNIKSIPGVMSIRGCAYAGLEGRGVGPGQGHGPHLARAGRPRRVLLVAAPQLLCRRRPVCRLFVTMQFTSDFQEKDIVFGGDKKLKKMIDEIEDLFPLNKGISVMSDCPVGLIGDDIELVAKQKAAEIGKPGSAGAVRGLPRRRHSRSATTSPTMRCATSSSTRARKSRSSSPPLTTWC